MSKVASKQFSYNALAEFFQSKVCNTSKKIGEEIARLNLSLDLLKKAQDKAGNPTLFAYYVTEGNRLVTLAKKDNDFIYHEVVPLRSKLTAIEKVGSARLAKPIPVPPLLSPTFKDLFDSLYPILVSSSEKPISQEPESNSQPTPTNTGGASPFKQVVDASLSAMSNYLVRYLEKQQQSK